MTSVGMENTKSLYTKCIPYFDKFLYAFSIQNLCKMYTKCLYAKCILHFDKLLYTKYLYTKCIPHFDKVLYTKCLYTKCIPHFDKLFNTFCIQNLAGIVLLILCARCIEKLVEMWYTFCIYFAYIHWLYTSGRIFVYKMYTQFLCVGRQSSNEIWSVNRV